MRVNGVAWNHGHCAMEAHPHHLAVNEVPWLSWTRAEPTSDTLPRLLVRHPLLLMLEWVSLGEPESLLQLPEASAHIARKKDVSSLSLPSCLLPVPPIGRTELESSGEVSLGHLVHRLSAPL